MKYEELFKEKAASGYIFRGFRLVENISTELLKTIVEIHFKL